MDYHIQIRLEKMVSSDAPTSLLPLESSIHKHNLKGQSCRFEELIVHCTAHTHINKVYLT